MKNKRKDTHDIQEDAPDLVLEINRARYGTPWCDTCGRPSVGTVSGREHITGEYPHGIPEEIDPADHRPTHKQWFDTPSHLVG